MPDTFFDLPSQPALLKAERAVRTVDGECENPVARLILDVPFSWPDKLYDYLVPAELDEKAVPGVRVRVQFGPKRVTGFLKERGSTTDAKTLRPLLYVLGDPVVTPTMFELVETLSLTHVCSRHDVLRSAVPPRHARAEKAISALPAPSFQPIDTPEPSPLGIVLDGSESLVPAGRSTWWEIARTVQEALSRGGTALIVVPTGTDIDQCKAALQERLPKEPIATIEAAGTAETRYRHYLSALQGRARIVLGTRAASFAPIEPDLIIIVDEGNGAMRDKRSPYTWADEVLRLRQKNATYLRFSYPPRLHLNTVPVHRGGEWPKVTRAELWAGDQRGLLPGAAFDVIRTGLESGPVIISAPRAGYVPALACAACQKRAVCQNCGSGIAVPTAGSSASCTTCGTSQWRCECGSFNMRAVARGSARLAQEIAAAFPDVGVDHVRSGTDESTLPLVIATPGAEPDREFAAGVILDAGARLASVSLDAEIEAVARWSRVAARVSGHVLLTGGVPPHLADALANRSVDFLAPIREEREMLGQPPYHRWFLLSGQPTDIQRLLGLVAYKLEGETPPEQGIAALLAGGGRQVFARGIHLVGPVSDDTGLTLHLHERAPATRLARVLRESLQELGQLAVRVEANPLI